jgi:hypothetical protein
VEPPERRDAPETSAVEDVSPSLCVLLPCGRVLKIIHPECLILVQILLLPVPSRDLVSFEPDEAEEYGVVLGSPVAPEVGHTLEIVINFQSTF